MLKTFLLLLLFLSIALILSSQKLNSEDYKVYSALIKTETSDTTKSIAVIKKSIGMQEMQDAIVLAVEAFKSKDPNLLYQVYSWTETPKNERPTDIDSITQQFIIDYNKNNFEKFKVSNQFNKRPVVFLVKKLPIKRHSIDKDWKTFYRKYPGSGGIFAFSKITYYSAARNNAITYYWIRRHGLNGHGALVVLEKVNNEWKIKYKTYLWWN
jgi:hypothetical protein